MGQPDPIDVLEQYIAGVQDGSLVVGVLVRRAVERFVRMLERCAAKRPPWSFDPETLRKWVSFCRLCRHQKGPLRGLRFEPSPWQVFILAAVFGFRKTDGRRLVREVYIEVARKNGKSFFLAVIGLGGMVIDGEGGAEIYSAATKRDQAKEIFDVASAIVKNSPELRMHLQPYKTAVVSERMFSKFEPLGRDADTTDGKNPHFALVDEYHAHRTRELWDVLDSGMGARVQPIMWTITTAGFNPSGPCAQYRHTMTQVLDPESDIEADDVFAFIACPDDAEAWQSEISWQQANPNWGVSVQEDGFRAAFWKSMRETSKQNDFKTKRLNMWVGAAEAWLPLEKWDACSAMPESLGTRPMAVGLDLSTKIDLTARVAMAWDGRHLDVWCHFWIPEERARERQANDRVPYLTWADEGLITLTDGDAIDFDEIRRDTVDFCAGHDVRAVALDPWQAKQLGTDLAEKDGLPVVEIRQGYGPVSTAAKECEGLVYDALLRHGGNKVLRWCLGNVVMDTDTNGNKKLNKKKARERIDGMAALLTGLAAFLVMVEEPGDYAQAVSVF